MSQAGSAQGDHEETLRRHPAVADKLNSHDRLICRVCRAEYLDRSLGERCECAKAALVPRIELESHPDDALLGSEVAGKYLIVGVLGAGGMGTVYRAVQEAVGREVALKTIRPQTAGADELSALRERFRREAKVVARLNHPATVRLFDHGVERSLLYLVFELVRGSSLAEILSREGPLGPRRTVTIAHQILGALAEAHAAGLVHRDIKPGNLMLSRGVWGEDWAKILDFGLAKAVLPDANLGTTSISQGALVGTPLYMAPEQAAERQVDARSDLYSLGAVLYECLTGQPPFSAPTLLGVLLAHKEREVPAIPAERGVPRTLEAVLRKALAKRPEDRFQDAQSMAAALLESLPAETGAGDDTQRSLVSAGLARTPSRLGPLAAAVAAGALLGAASTHLWYRGRTAALPELPPVVATPRVEVPPVASVPTAEPPSLPAPPPPVSPVEEVKSPAPAAPRPRQLPAPIMPEFTKPSDRP